MNPLSLPEHTTDNALEDLDTRTGAAAGCVMSAGYVTPRTRSRSGSAPAAEFEDLDVRPGSALAACLTWIRSTSEPIAALNTAVEDLDLLAGVGSTFCCCKKTPEAPETVEDLDTRAGVGSLFCYICKKTPEAPETVEDLDLLAGVGSTFCCCKKTPEAPETVEDLDTRAGVGSTFCCRKKTPEAPEMVEDLEAASAGSAMCRCGPLVESASEPTAALSTAVEDLDLRTGVDSTFCCSCEMTSEAPEMAEDLDLLAGSAAGALFCGRLYRIRASEAVEDLEAAAGSAMCHCGRSWSASEPTEALNPAVEDLDLRAGVGSAYCTCDHRTSMNVRKSCLHV